MPELPDPSRIESKGFTLHSALAFVERRQGPEGRQRLLAALDETSRRVLGGTVLASGWYPFRVQVATYEAIDRIWGSGDLALCWEIGRFTAEHEASTIHKLFLKLARIDTWLRVAGTMWGRYYSAGSLELGDFVEGSGEIRVAGFNPISKAFCNDLGGWFWRTAEMSGLHGVNVEHRSCVLHGSDACRYFASWKT